MASFKEALLTSEWFKVSGSHPREKHGKVVFFSPPPSSCLPPLSNKTSRKSRTGNEEKSKKRLMTNFLTRQRVDELRARNHWVKKKNRERERIIFSNYKMLLLLLLLLLLWLLLWMLLLLFFSQRKLSKFFSLSNIIFQKLEQREAKVFVHSLLFSEPRLNFWHRAILYENIRKTTKGP